MTLTLAIALNAVAAAGLIAMLVYGMTRPALLRPHVPAVAVDPGQGLERALATHPRRGRRQTRGVVRTVAAARS
jgi:hypothetical protein